MQWISSFFAILLFIIETADQKPLIWFSLVVHILSQLLSYVCLVATVSSKRRHLLFVFVVLKIHAFDLFCCPGKANKAFFGAGTVGDPNANRWTFKCCLNGSFLGRVVWSISGRAFWALFFLRLCYYFGCVYLYYSNFAWCYVFVFLFDGFAARNMPN